LQHTVGSGHGGGRRRRRIFSTNSALIESVCGESEGNFSSFGSHKNSSAYAQCAALFRREGVYECRQQNFFNTIKINDIFLRVLTKRVEEMGRPHHGNVECCSPRRQTATSTRELKSFGKHSNRLIEMKKVLGHGVGRNNEEEFHPSQCTPGRCRFRIHRLCHCCRFRSRASIPVPRL
jgi:hypothetical protein